MKIHFEREGAIFEWELKPMKEGRFRALCLLAAAGVYAGMVAKVAALCGIPGLGAVFVGTLFLTMIVSV